MAPETSVQAPESAPKTASRWEDFVDIFLSPGELFRRRADDSWTMPILVVCGLATVLYFAFGPVYQAIQEASLANNPNMTPERLEAMRNMGPVMRVFGGIFVPITIAVITLISAFFLWLTGLATSIQMRFKRALTITAYIGFVGVVQQIAMNVAMSLKLRSGAELDPIKDASFGVLRFMQPAELNVGVVALLSRIDIFALWIFAWYVIALMAAAKAPRGAALIAGSVVWLLGALPFLFQALGSR